jgi:ferredoxin
LRSPCEGTIAATKQHKTAGGWDEPTFGEGAYCSHCLVVLPEDKAGLVSEKVDDESQRLADYPFREDVGQTSRLGCRVEVTRDMDGMVVFVPNGAETESR